VVVSRELWAVPRITYEQEEEYRRLKEQTGAIDTLMARLTAYDAAMRIIVRHDLLKELADEMRAGDPAAQS
jgi:hypothetical protein